MFPVGGLVSIVATTRAGRTGAATPIAMVHPCANGATPLFHLAATAVLKSAGDMRTPKRSHQMITL